MIPRSVALFLTWVANHLIMIAIWLGRWATCANALKLGRPPFRLSLAPRRGRATKPALEGPREGLRGSKTYR